MLSKTPNALTTRCLSSKTMVYLGEVSYSLYMGHWLILMLIGQLTHNRSVPASVIWLSMLVGSQLFGVVLYHFVEVPGRALIRYGRLPWIRPGTHGSPAPAAGADLHQDLSGAAG